MANNGFLEMEILQAVRNGALPYARQLLTELPPSDRRIFLKQIRDTLDLLNEEAEPEAQPVRMVAPSTPLYGYAHALQQATRETAVR